MSPYTIPTQVRIGHVHLKVSDLERALSFYRDLLGFEVTMMYSRQAAFLSAGGYHHHIGLNTWHSEGMPEAPLEGVGLYHTAIAYPTRHDLALILKRLIEAEYPLTGASDHGVSEAIYLNDPDGALDEFERALAPLAFRSGFDCHGKTAVLGFPGCLGPRWDYLVCPDALRNERKTRIERLAPPDAFDDHTSAFARHLDELVRDQTECFDVIVVHLDDRAGLEVLRGHLARNYPNAFFYRALGDHVQRNLLRHGFASM